MTFAVTAGLVIGGWGWRTALDNAQAQALTQARELAAAQARVALEVEARGDDQAFFDETHARRTAGALESIVAERDQLRLARDAAQVGARSEFDASAGKADEGLRASLAQALEDSSGSGSVHSRLTATTSALVEATERVAGSRAAWDAAEAARIVAAEAARDTRQRNRAAVTSTPANTAGATAAGGSSVREAGEAALRALPGSDGVSISWDDPDLSGHLGAVWVGNTRTIMVNGAKLAGNTSKTRDVVRHEMAHIYQGRLLKAYALSWDELGARMSGAFGSNSQEKAADCVAKRFGAQWTHYSSSCGGADKQGWVDALIGGYLP